jgi:hypothetical protein
LRSARKPHINNEKLTGNFCPMRATACIEEKESHAHPDLD